MLCTFGTVRTGTEGRRASLGPSVVCDTCRHVLRAALPRSGTPAAQPALAPEHRLLGVVHRGTREVRAEERLPVAVVRPAVARDVARNPVEACIAPALCPPKPRIKPAEHHVVHQSSQVRSQNIHNVRVDSYLQFTVKS